jgi:DNA-3-methyladenine glycosylase
MTRLPRRSFARPATEVAPELLGHVLARRLPGGGVLRARIVETEAYEQDDPASHAYRGPTSRVRVMFGPPGHLYVYFTYGMHHCMNVVTGPDGTGSAVLLRAAEPLEGMDHMSIRRSTDRVRDLCRGPARLAQAFDVDRSLDGADLVRGSEIWIERDPAAVAATIRCGPRVGIRVGIDLPWRFWIDGPWVSVSRRTAVPSPR